MREKRPSDWSDCCRCAVREKSAFSDVEFHCHHRKFVHLTDGKYLPMKYWKPNDPGAPDWCPGMVHIEIDKTDPAPGQAHSDRRG